MKHPVLNPTILLAALLSLGLAGCQKPEQGALPETAPPEASAPEAVPPTPETGAPTTPSPDMATPPGPETPATR